MSKLLGYVFPEGGIYWIYPIIIMNLLAQMAFMFGFYKSYDFGTLGWILSFFYIVSVLYELMTKRRDTRER